MTVSNYLTRSTQIIMARKLVDLMERLPLREIFTDPVPCEADKPHVWHIVTDHTVENDHAKVTYPVAILCRRCPVCISL